MQSSKELKGKKRKPFSVINICTRKPKDFYDSHLLRHCFLWLVWNQIHKNSKVSLYTDCFNQYELDICSIQTLRMQDKYSNLFQNTCSLASRWDGEVTVHSVDRTGLEVHPRSSGSIGYTKRAKQLFSKGSNTWLTLKNYPPKEYLAEEMKCVRRCGSRKGHLGKAGDLEQLQGEGMRPKDWWALMGRCSRQPGPEGRLNIHPHIS